MANYFHVPFEDNKLDEKVKEAVKGSKLAEFLTTEEEEEENRGVFGTIHDLVDAAFDMYCYKQLTWSEMCQELSTAILKIKDKEGEFKEKLEEDEETDEEEDEEKEPKEEKE